MKLGETPLDLLQVTLNCYEDGARSLSANIPPGDSRSFSIPVRDGVELTCLLGALPIAGQRLSFLGDGASQVELTEEGCLFSGVKPGHANFCQITIESQRTSLTVYKKWIGASDREADVEVRVHCAAGPAADAGTDSGPRSKPESKTEADAMPDPGTQVIRRVIRGERNVSFEGLPSLRSALTWSPDGTMLALTAKSAGRDVLYLVRSKDGVIVKRFELKLDAMLFPAWSPISDTLAVVGIKDGRSTRGIAYPARLHGQFIRTFLRCYTYTGDASWLLRARDLADWNIGRSSPPDAEWPHLAYSTFEKGKPAGQKDKNALQPDKAAFIASASSSSRRSCPAP